MPRQNPIFSPSEACARNRGHPCPSCPALSRPQQNRRFFRTRQSTSSLAQPQLGSISLVEQWRDPLQRLAVSSNLSKQLSDISPYPTRAHPLHLHHSLCLRQSSSVFSS